MQNGFMELTLLEEFSVNQEANPDKLCSLIKEAGYKEVESLEPFTLHFQLEDEEDILGSLLFLSREVSKTPNLLNSICKWTVVCDDKIRDLYLAFADLQR